MTHRPYIQQGNWVNKTCSEKSVFLPHTNVTLIFKYSDFKTLQLKLTNLIIRLKHLEFTWSLHKMKYYLATLNAQKYTFQTPVLFHWSFGTWQMH